MNEAGDEIGVTEVQTRKPVGDMTAPELRQALEKLQLPKSGLKTNATDGNGVAGRVLNHLPCVNHKNRELQLAASFNQKNYCAKILRDLGAGWTEALARAASKRGRPHAAGMLWLWLRATSQHCLCTAAHCPW
jgi:hypothetical protein